MAYKLYSKQNHNSCKSFKYDIIRFVTILMVMIGGIMALPPNIDIASADESNSSNSTINENMNITFPSMEGISFWKSTGFSDEGAKLSGTMTAGKIGVNNNTVTFYAKIDIDKGYDPSNVLITSRWNTMSSVKYKYDNDNPNGWNGVYECKFTEINTSTSIIVEGLKLKDFNVILPKKVSGLSHLEYFEGIEGNYAAKGSVAGQNSITVNYGTAFKFYLKLRDEGYTRIMQDVSFTIKVFKQKKDSNTGEYITDPDVYLNFTDEEIDKYKITDLTFEGRKNDEAISNSGYMSSEYIVTDNKADNGYSIDEDRRNVIFVVAGIKKDQHEVKLTGEGARHIKLKNVSFTSDGEKISVNEISPENNPGSSEYGTITIEDGDKKPDYNTYIDFEIEIDEAYNQSWPKISLECYNNSLIPNGDVINSDVVPLSKDKYRINILGYTELKVENISKNKYKLNLPNISGVSFLIKNTSEPEGSESEWTAISGNYGIIEHGDQPIIKAVVDSENVGIDIKGVVMNFEGKSSNESFEREEYEADGYILFKSKFQLEEETQVLGSALKINYKIGLSLSSDTEGLQPGSTIDPNIVKFYDAYGTQIMDGISEVEHGSNFQFSIDVNYRYSKAAASSLEVYYIPSDGTEEKQLSLNDGIYTVPTVKGKKEGDNWKSGKIEVRGLTINRYKLSFINTEEVTFKKFEEDGSITDTGDEVEVKYGDVYNFKIDLSYGYSMENSRVTANDVAMRMKNEKYVLEDISEDITLEVQDISKIKYPIIFPIDTRGITFKDSTGYEITSANANYKDSYNFKIEVDSKYSQSQDKLRVYAVPMSVIDSNNDYDPDVDENGQDYLINKDNGGQYMISEVLQEVKIFVAGVVKNTYVVKLPVSTSELIFLINGEIITESNIDSVARVEHGENFNFELLSDKVGNLSSSNRYVYGEDGNVVSSKEYNKDGDLIYNYNYEYSTDTVFVRKLGKDGAEISQTKYNYSENKLISSEEIQNGVSIYNIQYRYENGNNKITSYIKTVSSDKSILTGTYNYMNDKLISIKEVDSQKNLIATYWHSYVDDKLVSLERYEGNTSYDTSNIEFSGATVESLNNGYIIQGVTSDLNINIKGVDLRLYNIYLTGENVKFYESTSSTTEIKNGQVKHGTDVFEFTISIDEAYNLIGDKPIVEVYNASGEGVSTAILTEPKNNTDTYKLTNVSEDVKITVSGLKIKSHKVTLPIKTEGIEFIVDSKLVENTEGIDSKSYSVNYGSDFQFEIKAKYGYDISSISVKANDDLISPSYGIYTISDIKQDFNVNVTNVELMGYNIKLRGDNLTFYDKSGTVPVNSGEIDFIKGTFDFKLSANTGYNISSGIRFYANDVNQNNEIILNDTSDGNKIHISGPNESGVYTISNVKERSIIYVTGAKKNIYTLTFPENPDGVLIKDMDNNTLPTQNNVEYMSEFNFLLEAKKGYNLSNVKVEVEPYGNAMIKNIDGGYKVYDIISDINVKISGTELNSYNVQLKGEGIDFYDLNSTQISNLSVKYGQESQFSIKEQVGYKIANGYTLSLLDNNDSSKKAFIKIGVNNSLFSYDSDSDTINISEKPNDAGEMERILEIVMDSNRIYVKYDSDGSILDEEYDSSKITIERSDSVITSIVNNSNKKKFVIGYNNLGQLISVHSNLSGRTVKFAESQYNAFVPSGTEIKQVSSATYAVSNVQGETTVQSEDVGKEQYYISLPTSIEGITFYNKNGQQINESTVRHCDAFSFSI